MSIWVINYFNCQLFSSYNKFQPAKHTNAIQSRLEMAICGLRQKSNDKFAHCMDFICVSDS